MKKYLFLFAMVLMGMTLMANPVDPDKAMQVAKNFVMTQVKMDSYNATIVYTHLMPKTGEPAFYAVNVGGSAFVLVAADDIAHPVLGYSMSRSWPTGNADGSSASPRGEQITLPSQVSAFLDDLASQIEAAHQQGVQSDSETIAEWQQLLTSNASLLTTTNLPDSVGPLLTTTWDQGQYYNDLCPEDANGPAGHTYTGCVATAMAQIINYWGYPVHGRGTHSYETNYGTLTVNYDSVNYDYTHMPNALTSTSTPQEVQAVAILMRDCGVAANMDYSPNESGSLDIDARAGMINYFRLNPGISYAEKNYFSNAEWKNMLRADIANGRPVFYGGQGTGGHAFVCDGYKQNGYFHFNFGWSGYADGWYLTSAVNPAGMAFNSVQSALLGIFPDSTGNVILGQMAGTSTFTVDEPLEFYHLLGHNAYSGTNYSNTCSSNVNFVSINDTVHLVVDIVYYDGQNLNISAGDEIRSLNASSTIDLSPMVSSNSWVSADYYGTLSYSGFKLCISPDNGCRMISNIVTSIDTTTVHLSWIENGTATQWQVEYGTKGFALGDGSMILANDTTVSINGLTKFETYDFYIRPICGGSWFGPITIMASAPYWIDVITSQPEGYSIDSAGNVTISSVEGLAWWAKLADNQYRYWRWMVYQEPFVPTIEGLDEANLQNGWYYACPTTITTDINLDGYRWKPVSYYADIDGQMHTLSNMLIYEDASMEPEPYYGFLRYFSGPSQIGYTIKDLVFQTPVINCPTGYYGVLAGGVSSANIRNVGANNAVINQYSSSPFISIYNVYGVAGGGLIGHAELTNIDNCYSTGNIVSEFPYPSINNGGIVGYAENLSSINNCYSSVQIQSRTGGLGSICALANGLEMKNCYGVDYYPILGFNYLSNGGISDTIRFNKTSQQLYDSVFFDDLSCNTLLEALNMRVVYENSGTWMTWSADTSVINDSLPIFSEPYNVTCPNVENIEAANVIIDNQNALLLIWEDNNNVSQWRIKCVEKDSTDNTAHYYLTDSNSIAITDLTLAKLYRIYVKPICGDTNQGGWGSGIEHVYEKPYWTDFVTSQPDGYFIDNDGNVTITSREGFVWLSCLSNGLHGQECNNFRGKHIHLMTDIDLSQYRWMPIGNSWFVDFEGSFDAHNHTISNVYVNEVHDWVGLFGHVFQAQFLNMVIDNSIVKGYSNVGTICGYYKNTDINYEEWWSQWNFGEVLFNNCHIKNTAVFGDQLVGSLVGRVENWIETTITNCSASGEVHGSYHVGGLIGNIKEYATISNCYSTCDIYATEMDAGGLIGFTKGCTLENSYATGTITSTGGSYGKLVGYLCENIIGHHLYGFEDDNPINLFGYIGPYCIIDNTGWFSNTGILNNSVTITDSTYTNLLSALNAWVDANDTLGIYRHWAADSANVNGGYPVFAAIPCPVINVHDTVVACENYTWNGTQYNSSLVVTDTLSTINGCDSTVTLHLTLNLPVVTEVYDAACESYTWYGTTYTATGDYVRTGPSAFPGGCDTTETLHLTINSPVHTATTQAACESYTWNNASYTTSGNYTYSHADANGCTQVDTLHLTINNPVHFATTQATCETYTWNGTSYTVSGNYTYSHTDANGCTQVDTLHLTINLPVATEVSDTVCESYTWFGTTYTATGDYVRTGPSAYPGGCDTTETLHLTINNPVHIATTQAACESYTWNNTAYTTSGDYTFSHLDANGCTQVDTLHLTINLPVVSEVYDTACESYTWYGTTYTATDDYVRTGPSAFPGGCDTTETLHLTINNPVHTAIAETACESYSWNNTNYTASGNYIYSHLDANGCTQVDTLHLTINIPVHTATTEAACESYTWNNTAYTTSGTYTYTHADANGCTQVDTLHLTINMPVVTEVYDTACESYTWYGTTYTTTGDYVRTGTSAYLGGCDTTETLHLTINYSVTLFDTLSLFSNELPYNYHGNTINAEGDYTFTSTTTEGCDSTVYLYVTVTPVSIFEIQNSEFEITIFPNPTNGVVTIACDEVTWVEVMDVSGRKVQTVENSNRIDLSKLPSGVYTLQITTPRGKALKRVIRK